MDVHLRPEQEAFIEARVRAGRFPSTDEALREAVGLLQRAELVYGDEVPGAGDDVPGAESGSGSRPGSTGEDLIAVMKACPYPEVDLEPIRIVMPVREPAF